MFTGIIEDMGRIVDVTTNGSNVTVSISSSFLSEIKVDQSIAHNGVCLTVTEIGSDYYSVDIIQESLVKSNFDTIRIGQIVNLERCMKLGDRLDGHMVQGHVDTTAICTSIKSKAGSWYFGFSFDENHKALLVNKGSVCVNGVSLTVIDPGSDTFQVAIIPYTFEHTNFKFLQVGSVVNLEFDIIGKYLERHLINRKM